MKSNAKKTWLRQYWKNFWVSTNFSLFLTKKIIASNIVIWVLKWSLLTRQIQGCTSQNSSFSLPSWESLLVVGSSDYSLNFLTTGWDASIVSSEAIALRPSGLLSMRSGSRWALSRWMYTLSNLFYLLKNLRRTIVKSLKIRRRSRPVYASSFPWRRGSMARNNIRAR